MADIPESDQGLWLEWNVDAFTGCIVWSVFGRTSAARHEACGRQRASVSYTPIVSLVNTTILLNTRHFRGQRFSTLFVLEDTEYCSGGDIRGSNVSDMFR